MANEYKLSFTAKEIDQKLEAVGNTILFTEQSLTDDQKKQVRANIGALSLEDLAQDVTYEYNGDYEAENTWVTNYNGVKSFVKVGDLPKGRSIDLLGGSIYCVKPENRWEDYTIEITQEKLTEVIDVHDYWVHATVPGFTQIFHQSSLDSAPITVMFICTKPGFYDLVFDGWYETLHIMETGIYFFDKRGYSVTVYVGTLNCTVMPTSGIGGNDDSGEVENPIDYKGNEITVFSRGICIGDSVTSGVFDSDQGGIEDKRYSYPSILRRLSGIELVNAGIPGATSQTWYEASMNGDTLGGRWIDQEWIWSMDSGSSTLDYAGFDFAIILLGINDMVNRGDMPIADLLANYENNINNIITALKTANNGIKIFLATIPSTFADPQIMDYAELNTQIRKIVVYSENVYLLNLNKYSELAMEEEYNTHHPTAIGYQKIASEIYAIISYIIKYNLSEFKTIQFIGTTHTIS